MKTLGRILIILAVFTLIMGGLYVAVNASSSGSANAAQLDRPFPVDGDRPALDGGQLPQFENDEHPDFPRGDHDEFGEAGFGGFGWMFGAVKNTGIVAIIVALIVLPRGWKDRKRRAPQQTAS